MNTVWPKPHSVWQHKENQELYIIILISKFKENGEWKTEPLVTYCKFQAINPEYYSRYQEDFLSSFILRLS